MPSVSQKKGLVEQPEFFVSAASHHHTSARPECREFAAAGRLRESPALSGRPSIDCSTGNSGKKKNHVRREMLRSFTLSQSVPTKAVLENFSFPFLYYFLFPSPLTAAIGKSNLAGPRGTKPMGKWDGMPLDLNLW